MTLNRTTNIFYKTIACIIAVVFLSYDISWAALLTDDLTKDLTSSSGLMTPSGLADGQNTAQSLIDAKNAVVICAVTAASVTTSYYTSGRKASETLTTPDAAGNIYYHYIDENWNSQGYGRIDQAKRQTALSGVLSYKYTYYADATGRLYQRTDYATAAFGTPVARYTYANDAYGRRIKKETYSAGVINATYTYFNDATNRMSSKILAAADASGNYYYHYINENWASLGYGRVDQAKRKVALNGVLSYSYTYYADATGKLYQKTEYADLSFLTPLTRYTYANDATARIIKKEIYSSGAITTTYTYYNDANLRMSSKTLAVADASGYVYYHYLNENWASLGYGRVDQSRRQTASGGELAYTFTYNADAYGRLLTKRAYSDAGFTALLATYNYYNDATNRKKSKTLVTPDASGNIYFYWLNEAASRLSIVKRQTPSGSGWIAYKNTYSTVNTSLVVRRDFYSDTALTVLHSTYTYYDNATNRLSSITLVTPDTTGNIYYHYKDESWGTLGYGRVDQSKRKTASGGELSHTYTYYADAYGRLQTKYAYSTASWTTLVATYSYYNDATNRVQAKTLTAADASGNIYYHYMNEAASKVDKTKRATALNGALSYAYTYYVNPGYPESSGWIQTKSVYSDANWTTLISTSTYYNDPDNRLFAIVYPSGAYTYYFNDATNRMWVKTLAAPDASGNIRYYYMNEDWNGQGYGRASIVQEQVVLNGTIYHNVYYYNLEGPGRVMIKDVFLDLACTIFVSQSSYYNDADNRLSRFVDTTGNAYTYYNDANGRLWSKYDGAVTCNYYTYFNDASGLMESKFLATVDASGNIKYSYLNENWNNQGYGRITKQIRPDGSYTTFESYYAGVNQARYVKEYSATGVLLNTFEYDASGNPVSGTNTYYASGKLESNTLSSPDSNGNIYYHYIDENWLSQGYGRVDRAKRETALNGELSYAYSYYADVTSRLQTKSAYSDANWTTLISTLTYFNDATGRLYSKTDSAGTYTYYNDATNRLATRTDATGTYTYNNDATNRLASKVDSTGTTTYYNDAANLMESRTLTVPDASGNIYYHYMNEAASRVDKSKRQTALNGELSYTYSYYADATGRLQTKRSYSDTNWTTLVATYAYNNDAANRLATRVDATGTYAYNNDAANRLASKVDSTGTTTYYNDAANLMESKTLTVPDASGNIYYHYLNEAASRVDKSKRQTALNGELSYAYAYYADANGRLQTKRSYSDANWTTLVATYTYNNDATNRLASKVDAATNTTYTYYNDATNRLATRTDATGTYTYNNDATNRLASKVDSTGTTTYYNDAANLMESKTLAAVDASGNIYYHYINENWLSQGFGRADKAKRQTALNGELSYTYAYYADATGRLQTKRSYSDANWTTLVATYTYNNDAAGRLASKLDAATNTTYTYYNDATNLMESKTLTVPDASGNIYYHYLNEAASRVDKSKRQTALNGELSYAYAYYADANGRLQTKRSYSDANWTTLVATYTYNNDAAGRLASKLDAATNTTYTYYNDATNRLATRTDATGTYTYNNDATNRLASKVDSTGTTTYYNDAANLMESKTLVAVDASGNIYYHYINENWLSQGFGRADKAKRQTALNGELSYTYAYYADATGRLQTKRSYSDANWTMLVATYTYNNDAAGRLASKLDAATNTTYTYFNDATNRLATRVDATGTYAYNNDAANRLASKVDSTGTTTYYNDAANLMESKTLTVPDASGNIYYHYLNEAASRVDKSKRQTALNGELSYTYSYYADATGRLQTKRSYSDAGYTVLVATYIYYNDAANRVGEKTLVAADASGNIYYHYMNEAASRVDKSKRAIALNSELSHKYIYDTVTGDLKEIKAYSDNNWTLLIPKTMQDFFDVGFDYFTPGNGTIEPISGYPHEGYIHTNYTQPTNLGFYAQLLANVITGDIVTADMSPAQAIAALDKMMTTLVSDQARIGYQGLMPWISFNTSTGLWQRDAGQYGKQVVLCDNANLSASLGAAIGALLDPDLAGNAAVAAIRQKMEAFLDAQAVGYNQLYDAVAKKFRTGMYIAGGYMAGYQELFDNEFRSGVLFVTLRYNLDSTSATNGYSSLNGAIMDYTLANGQTVYTVAPWDGGAFQMLWPTLTMPEIDNPGLNEMLANFVTIALDFSKRNNLPGFLSACYSAVNTYAGNAGIAEISMNPSARNQSVASLYTLGAAHMVAPAEIEQFLRDIFVAHPDLVTLHGLWEGFNKATNSVINEQIVANVATFLIGMAGKGPEHMTRYLQNRSLYQNLQNIYQQGNAFNALAGSTNTFTWGTGVTGAWSNGTWRLTSSSFLSTGYTAFIQSSINMSGRRLRIRYRSTTAVGTGTIELKQVTTSPTTRFTISTLAFQNTGGVEQEIIIDLPTASALCDIDEIILMISGGTGQALDMTITGLDII